MDAWQKQRDVGSDSRQVAEGAASDQGYPGDASHVSRTLRVLAWFHGVGPFSAGA